MKICKSRCVTNRLLGSLPIRLSAADSTTAPIAGFNAAAKARWRHDAAVRRKPQAKEGILHATPALVPSERPGEHPPRVLYDDTGNVIKTRAKRLFHVTHWGQAPTTSKMM